MLPRGTFVVLAVVAALGVILTSAYFLAVMRSMLQGAPGAAVLVEREGDTERPSGSRGPRWSR